MALKCDVQYRKGDTWSKLTKVGVTGVRKPVAVKRYGANSALNGALNCSIDIFVDLPAEQKGSHLSRNVEVLNEVVEESLKVPVTGLENMASDICKKLLAHHEYAKTAHVDISAEYFRESRTPFGRGTLEIYKLLASGSAVRGKGIRKTIGVEVIGMTACPCAQQTVTEMISCGNENPVMSHNQRNVCTALFTMNDDIDIEADEIIDLVQGAFSSPTYELLKRDDEGQVVINAHKNPRFVEDVVRNVLEFVVERFKELPDDVLITVKSESEESIHKHNAFAERTTTLEELRAEYNKGTSRRR
ncbi:GTP cyclohydrolase MptA [Candidatus Methanoplasma termitum]|uniref:GTP cyclohydrolase MptA n=1 Tax=Candidatus Methanoplasma termitum TaxID=1577791 RepID=A0A0A7LCD6_9ARCH|nr:GTP cyclohydrolase MptA [Candidatus Methanoplasma termitum]AIZ56850.1 GTP cyclohydrolase MptA [Candidatus Methanoplasma termitum]MCL2333210.1 GTP cyclohydrolase MptA [Candidatus Methanoplasma sp.]